MDYYNEIRNKLIDDEVYSCSKDYSKERHRVITYYEIGKLLNVLAMLTIVTIPVKIIPSPIII